MFEHPTKVFPCDCSGEGIAVTKYHDEDDISEGEVLVSEAKDMRDCMESPYIDFSFWEFGHHTHGRWSWWWRLKIAWRVFRKGTPWPDMVMLKAKHAKNLANHILYIINKGEKEKKLGEPIVKEEPRSGKVSAEDWDETLKKFTGAAGEHSYFCVQHGGSAACEESNKKHGFTCSKCDQDKIIADVRKR